MRNMLAAANLHVLRQFAWSDVLLAFDYDGTLAPIIQDPEQAWMRARTRALLAQVAQRYRCAVISGRAQWDLLRRLRGVGVVEAIGNHGLEPSRYPGKFVKLVRTWVPKLQRQLAGLGGVVIEDKGFSLAIHYRRSREKRRARAAIRQAIAALTALRIINGKLVFNLVPEGAPHKGIALRSARTRFKCDTAIYVGDDETDEDVFGLDEPGRLLSVRVGASVRSRADYFIRNQRSIDAFLKMLLTCRSEGTQRSPSGAALGAA
jgi:trehalose 6-phosphate phosphatase